MLIILTDIACAWKELEYLLFQVLWTSYFCYVVNVLNFHINPKIVIQECQMQNHVPMVLICWQGCTELFFFRDILEDCVRL